MSFWFIAFRTLSHALTLIGLGGALVLYVQSLRSSTDRRVLRALALILLMWGLPSLPDCFIPQTKPWFTTEPLGVVCIALAYLGVLIWGNRASLAIHRFVATVIFGTVVLWTTRRPQYTIASVPES